MTFHETLKKLDGHSAVSNEFRVHTLHGAILSVVTVVTILYLTYTEYRFNFQIQVIEKVHVNETAPAGLEIDFDITFPSVPCAILSIDANDPTGQKQSLHLDQKHHIWKHRLSKEGGLIGKRKKLEMGSSLLDEEELLETVRNATQTYDDDDITLEEIRMKPEECMSCYGAGDEGECCNTCDDVKRAYTRKGWTLKDKDKIEQCKDQATAKDEEGEGCNVHGKIALSTGGGNLHLAPNRGLDTEKTMSIIDVFLNTFESFNVSHSIGFVRFGGHDDDGVHDDYPGRVHQLDGEKRILQDSYGMYQYYLQIVPTTYKYLDGMTVTTNQYSVTEHMRHVSPGSGRGLPGVFFFYEVSALHVVIEESLRGGWVAFFTSIAAIVGGVVTFMGIIDQTLYSSSRRHRSSALMR